MPRPEFTVVGGGIAGLVVARRLALGGASVVLHESTRELGGTVAAHSVGRIVLDAGAESFAVRGGTVAALLGELGLADDIVAPRPGTAWLHRTDGRAVPLPATSLLGIPSDPLAADVAAVIGADAAARAASLDDRPVRDVPDTLGGLVRERMGDAVLEGLVAPVVRGVHSTDPDALPIDRAHPRLRDAVAAEGSLARAVAGLRAAAPAGSAVGGLRGGMHRLSAALAGDVARLGVDVHLGSYLDATDAAADSAAVVLASPRPDAAPGRDITLVTLVVHAPELDTAPRGSGVLVAAGPGSGIRARALTHATAKWDWLREEAGGLHVLRLSYDGDPGQRFSSSARADASALLGVALPPEAVIDAARITWTRPAPAEPTGATVVGETVAGSGLAGIVAHAERTAENLLAD